MQRRFQSLAGGCMLAAAALVAGCADGESRGLFDVSGLTGSSDRATFTCDDDRFFRVNYNDDGEEAVVSAGERTYRLDLDSRNGSRRIYQGDDAELSVKGDNARLRISGEDDFDDCDRA